MIVMSVVGARPQFVKLAPMSSAFESQGIEHVIVHTGQHYDQIMSDSFFEELDIPHPDYQLTVGSASHGRQTGEMMIELESVMEKVRPDWVLVYGDTNSTLAAALCAAKMNIPLAHLEAGLRSFNRSMPEEHNRVLTDHSADLLLAPTEVAAQHLKNEGLEDKTFIVGDVMTDVLYKVRDEVASVPNPLSVPDGGYYIATIHRPQNTDSNQRLTEIIASLQKLDKPVFLLAHPRLKAAAEKLGLYNDGIAVGTLNWSSPLAYPDLVRAALGADAIVTDSGGLQKEAFLLGTPCVTVRTETEWVETVELGWNTLIEPDQIAQSLANITAGPINRSPYGDGTAAKKVGALLEELYHKNLEHQPQKDRSA